MNYLNFNRTFNSFVKNSKWTLYSHIDEPPEVCLYGDGVMYGDVMYGNGLADLTFELDDNFLTIRDTVGLHSYGR